MQSRSPTIAPNWPLPGLKDVKLLDQCLEKGNLGLAVQYARESSFVRKVPVIYAILIKVLLLS